MQEALVEIKTLFSKLEETGSESTAEKAFKLLCHLGLRSFYIRPAKLPYSEEYLVELFQNPEVYDTAKWAKQYIKAAENEVPSVDWIFDSLYFLPQLALVTASTTILKHAKQEFIGYMKSSFRKWFLRSGWSLMNFPGRQDHCCLLLRVPYNGKKIHIATRDWQALLHWMVTTPLGATIIKKFWEACGCDFKTTHDEATCMPVVTPPDFLDATNLPKEGKLRYFHHGVLATSSNVALLQTACAILGDVKHFWHWQRSYRRKLLRKGQLARRLVKASADKMEALMKKSRLRAMVARYSWEEDIMIMARDYARYLELEAAAFALQREFLRFLPRVARKTQQALQQHVARGLRKLVQVQDMKNTFLRTALQKHSRLFDPGPVCVKLHPLSFLIE